MNSGCSFIGEIVLALPFFTLAALQGCSRTAGEAGRITEPNSTLPITLASSTDFGCLRFDSGPVVRLVEIRNSSNAIVQISRWDISCNCLTVQPSSIDVGPEKSTYIRLVFHPAKDGERFAGGLRMSVDGFGEADRVCTFEVPVSVIAPDDTKHLDDL